MASPKLMHAPKMKMITCPLCDKEFYREAKTLHYPIRCPACQGLIKGPKMKAQKYAIPTLEGRLLRKAAGFAKRHAGLLSAAAIMPVLVNEVQRLLAQIEAQRASENYGLAGLSGTRTIARKAVHTLRGRRKLRRSITALPKTHPKTTLGLGMLGAGAFVGSQRKEPRTYANTQFPRLHTPGTVDSSRAKALWQRTKPIGRKIGKVAGTVALVGLIDWVARSILSELEKKRLPAIGPYMPEVRADIELSRGYCLNQVVTYATEIPITQLYALQGKLQQTLQTLKSLPHKAKVGAEKGMLVWLLGFLSAEILGRGITTPKRRVSIEGEVPIRRARYETRDAHIPTPNMPFDPRSWTAENKAFDAETKRMVKGIKKTRRTQAVSNVKAKLTRKPFVGPIQPHIMRRRKIAKRGGVALPLLALASAALIRRRRNKKKDYFAAVAAKSAVKVGKWATTKKWGSRALTGLIVGDLASAAIPRKAKLPPVKIPGNTAYKTPQSYAIGSVRRIATTLTFLRKNLKAWETTVSKAKNAKSLRHAKSVANRFRNEIKTIEVLASGERKRNIGAVALGALGTSAAIPGYIAGKKVMKQRIKKAIGE